MKTRLLPLTLLCSCLLAIRAAATTYYVDINSPDPTPPYTTWTTAATNIQDAINETINGDTVLVNPGVYQSSGYAAPDGTLTTVDVTNTITVQSANGLAATSINGNNVMRCVYLASGASLIGFTLTGGTAQNGGGIYCASTAGTVISNCLVTANAASNQGGGAYQGTFFNCTISDNIAGGEYSEGGGACDAVLTDCMIISNSIFSGYGCGVYDSTVTSSVIAGNSQSAASINSGEISEGGGAFIGTLYHCNITGNSATAGGGTYESTLVNCIDYFNVDNPNYSPGSSNYCSGTITYTCTTPNPGNSGDITNDPQLASASHISLASPCRGAGTTADSSGVDIDGNFYADPPSMGCFEPYPGNVLGNLTVEISPSLTNWALGYALNLQANISGPVYSNVWSFGDGTFITNDAYVSHSWPTNGTYPVTLTAYNDNYPTGVTTTLPITVSVPSVYYVNLNSQTPIPPYVTWSTAAINIQDAVNVATPGSLVLVTNGPTIQSPANNYISNSAAFYMGGSANVPYPYNSEYGYRIAVTNNITVESVNGPATTYIWGDLYRSPNSANCAFLGNGATLSGFTFTNYQYSPGYGQIATASTNAIITNCIMANYVTVDSGTLDDCSLLWYSSSANSTLNSCIISNNSYALGGILNNCILVNNTNLEGGGPAQAAYIGLKDYPIVLYNCLISNNVAESGGGVSNAPDDPDTNCILNNCILIRNSATENGGGAYNAELNNCLICSNQAPSGGGVEGGFLVNCMLIGNSNSAADGTEFLLQGTVLTNCTLIANTGRGGATECTLDHCTLLQNVGTEGGGAYDSVLNNCLIISNLVRFPGFGGGAYFCELTNCILADNVATNGGGAYSGALVNCTVAANAAVIGGGIYASTAENSVLYYNTNGDFDPGLPHALYYCCTSILATNGFRNITNAPLFVNLVGGDFHLQPNSPCINSGDNAYITATTDLDGNPRTVGGTVDIGAYEYQNPTSVISYAYLQQYGLPTDGSVDFKDLDGTAFNVYQDWIAGLNPTNPASVLAMVTPVTTNITTGVKVTWQSVSGISYFLQRSTNLMSQPPFTTIQNNITGQTNTTSYTDTTATGSVPCFYRVGVIAP